MSALGISQSFVQAKLDVPFYKTFKCRPSVNVNARVRFRAKEEVYVKLEILGKPHQKGKGTSNVRRTTRIPQEHITDAMRK